MGVTSLGDLIVITRPTPLISGSVSLWVSTYPGWELSCILEDVQV